MKMSKECKNDQMIKYCPTFKRVTIPTQRKPLEPIVRDAGMERWFSG